jgi:hypothetical protein
MLQNWGPIAVIIAGYLLGIYFQNWSIAHLDKRIDDVGKRFDDVGKRFDDVLRRIDDTRDLLRAEMRAMKTEIVAEIERQANRKVV